MRWMRADEVAAAMGQRSRGAIRNDVKRGLLPQPVRIGRRALWPDHELRAIDNARLRGATKDEIRALVKQLEEARKKTEVAA